MFHGICQFAYVPHIVSVILSNCVLQCPIRFSLGPMAKRVRLVGGFSLLHHIKSSRLSAFHKLRRRFDSQHLSLIEIGFVIVVRQYFIANRNGEVKIAAGACNQSAIVGEVEYIRPFIRQLNQRLAQGHADGPNGLVG